MALTALTHETLGVIKRRIAVEHDQSRLSELFADYDEVSWTAAKEDAWFFLTRLVKTKNELGDEGEKYEPFPEHDYLRFMLRQWIDTDAKPADKLHLTAKSRQIMASWFACAMVLYHCMTGKAVRVGWQGKKAEDTNEMLERIFGTWERLPECVKKAVPCERRFLHLHFPTTDSDIHAIPQGEAQVRQYTWRYFISDEMAFQENAEESYYALLPALGKAGMVWIISTAGPGHFETLYQSPMLVDSHQQLMAGMETWLAKNGMQILRLHWSADPTKDETWANKESAKYGGRLSSYWRSEYEIDFGARRGGLVFPQFSIDTHVIKPLTDQEIETWPKWRVIDPGYNNECAVGFYTCNDGVLYLYDEIFVREKVVGEIAPLIKVRSGKTKFEYTLIDPSAFAETLAADGKSIASLFAENGITVNPARRAPIKGDQIPALAELMVVQEHGQPRFKVTSNCENFIREVRGYRWREARDDQSVPEEPVKVNDHMVDTALYAAANINPKFYQENRDPLAKWYDGLDGRKIKADFSRMRSAVANNLAEMEP
jgi:hypothetical protein